MPTLDELRASMDARYAAGPAYSDALPYDRLMRREIADAVMRMVYLCGEAPAPTLDVGCGSEGIARFWPHQEIVGIELSETALVAARRLHPKVTYVAAAVEQLGPEHTPLFGSFQMAVAVESIEHWYDVDKGLDSVHRALAMGGSFILTTPNRDSLHCRMARKLGHEAPYVAYDHIHEFGFDELIARVESHGFHLRASTGAHLAPYWTLEHTIGSAIRRLTDTDEEVLGWLNEIGRNMPPRFANTQAHRFQKRLP